MTKPALDSRLCPLCGNPNVCGMAAGSETCWCFSVTIRPEALAQLPEEARGVVCICATCAASDGTSRRKLPVQA